MPSRRTLTRAAWAAASAVTIAGALAGRPELQRLAKPLIVPSLALGMRPRDRLDAAALDDVERVVLATEHGDAVGAQLGHPGVAEVADAGPDHPHARGARVVADVVGHVAHRTDVTDEQRRLEREAQTRRFRELVALMKQ